MYNVVDFVFEGGTKRYIGFSSSKAFWCKDKQSYCFSQASLKSAIEHLIVESYFQIGNRVLLQTIGIPMGIDPAPFWANLYLHRHEYRFMSKLIHTDIARARKFHGCARFIDDICLLNDGGEFCRSYEQIYPAELTLKCEHNGQHATFLELDISIVDGIFVYKLFDKRDDFKFFIVRMPDRESNIPSYIFYGTVLSEYLRIARATLLIEDFLPKVASLYNRMLSQGGEQHKIIRQFHKAMSRHPILFEKFNATPKDIIHNIRLRIT